MSIEQLSSSFRDPSGFLYRQHGRLFRQVNESYREDYNFLKSSGLYKSLVEKNLLIAHEEVDGDAEQSMVSADRYMTIKPHMIPYVSYPYEWGFSQLKDAALLTLDIQSMALDHGMTLKDASGYNVQFIGSRPVFIDTLSFERYQPGRPWIAYRQFCQHFLGPLAVMAFRDVRLRHLLRSFIDGLPLDLVSRLLPRKTYLKYSLLAHIHLHASSQRRHENAGRDSDAAPKKVEMSKTMQVALGASLRSAIEKCRMQKMETEWGDYYEDTNYSSTGMSAKEAMVVAFVDKYVGLDETIHDFGANTGRFSRLVAKSGRYVLSHDIDENAVERNYVVNNQEGIDNVLPLVLDLNNPSPGLGWALEERDSLQQRVDGDVVLALAIIHHIVISNNVPLSNVADFFHQIASKLIIEFVPKEDSQVRRLLATREDIFPKYNVENFEEIFARRFTVLEKRKIEETDRTLFILERR